jgi:ATPase subunit of ABC transporter with duplicated ATPase domains
MDVPRSVARLGRPGAANLARARGADARCRTRKARAWRTRTCYAERVMIRLDSVSKQHGSQILFLEASMGVFRGDKVGLVGPNGSGKSTIFRMIVKEEQPDAGQVAIDRNVTIGYFSQDVGEMAGRTVIEETLAGAGAVSEAGAELHALEHAMADPARADELDQLIERFGVAQARFDQLGGYALESRAREILAGLGFRPDSVDDDVGKLSGGFKMRVALARILLMQPDALLLDEPTNHLDLESIIWLERFLREFQGALVLTSHDREFMNRLCTKIVEIDGGELTTYTGNYDFYEQQRAVMAAQQEAQFARQQAMLKKEEAFIARFKARASHAAQVQSRVKKLDKIEKIEPPKRRKVIEFEFRPAPRSGDDVAKLESVVKRYGARAIYDGFDLLIRRRERWCVMGVNGAGKSTLLKLVAGESKPDAGNASLGASVKLGYFAQHSMEVLDAKLTVFETLQGAFPLASVGSLKSLAGAFGFSGDDADKSCRVLSGGEKARLVLALMLYDPPNFLVLDEPTNHLDMATKEMLVKALSNFEGTMLFVSHDRAFLRALSNRVLELTPEGAHAYGGGYAEYVVQSGHEAPGVS